MNRVDPPLVFLLLAFFLAGCVTGAATPAASPTSQNATAYPALVSPYPAPNLPMPYPAATQPGPTLPAPTLQTGGPKTPPTAPPSTGRPGGAPANSYAPQPGDANLQRGKAFIDKASVATLESMPPQFVLYLSGSLPTPCHSLRVEIGRPDARQNLPVTVYTLVIPDQICTQVLAPLEASVPLTGLGHGQYTVLVNGHPVGTIDVP